MFPLEIPVETTDPIHGGPPGLVLRVTVEGQHALLANMDGSCWTRQPFPSSDFLSDFAEWRGGSVGVGGTVVLGRARGPVPLPTLSGLGLALLILSLLALTQLSLRRRAD